MGESSSIDYHAMYVKELHKQIESLHGQLYWFREQLETAYARGFVTAQGQPKPVVSEDDWKTLEKLDPIPGIELPSERRIRLAKESREKARKQQEEEKTDGDNAEQSAS